MITTHSSTFSWKRSYWVASKRQDGLYAWRALSNLRADKFQSISMEGKIQIWSKNNWRCFTTPGIYNTFLYRLKSIFTFKHFNFSKQKKTEGPPNHTLTLSMIVTMSINRKTNLEDLRQREIWVAHQLHWGEATLKMIVSNRTLVIS